MVQPLRSSSRIAGTRLFLIGTLCCGSALTAFAQPIASPTSPAAAEAVRQARSLVYNLDDAPCTPSVRAQVDGEASELMSRLRFLRGIAAIAGRTSEVYQLDQAMQSLDNAVEDYFEDCGPGLANGFFYIPGTDTAVRIAGYVRMEERFIGDKIGVGVRPIPGDPFFAKQDDSLRGIGLGGSLSYTAGQWQYSLGMKYSWGDGVRNAQSQNGTDVGYSPGDAGAGPGFSDNNAFTASTKAKYSQFSLSYSAMRQFNLVDGFNWGWKPAPGTPEESEKYFGLIGSVDISRFSHDGHMYWTNFPNQLDIRIDQALDTYSFTAGPRFAGRRKFGTGFYLFAMGDLQAGFMYSKLDSREDILCPGACLPPVININDSKTDFAWRANAEIGAGYTFAQNFDVKATVGLQVGNRHILDVRRNPTDKSTHIATDTGFDWNAGIKVHYKF